jgi:hypothetical protein
MAWDVKHPPSNPIRSMEKVSVSYTAGTLLQQLMKKIVDHPPKEDQTLVIEELVRSLSSEALAQSTPSSLMDAAFRIGYFYRVFLERNDVVYSADSVSKTSTTTS